MIRPRQHRQALGVCTCGKYAYTSKADAKASARRIYPGTRMRVYKCRRSSWWHLTSQNAARTAHMRDWLARRAS